MMKNKIKSTLFVLLLGCSLVNAQEFKKAEQSFNNLAYKDAIDQYEKLVEEGNDTVDVLKKIGDAYYYNAQYDDAGKWYAKLFSLEVTDPEPEYIYRYVMTLRTMGEYGKADDWMHTFKTLRPSDSRALRFEENRDYLAQIAEHSNSYSVKKLAINSGHSDFAPSMYGKMLVFSSAKDTSIATRNVHLWNNEPFQKLYSVSLSNDGPGTDILKFAKELDTKSHETSTAFSKDGKTVYFTRNNFKNGNFSRDRDGISRLKILRAVWEDGKWGQVTELPFNGEDYSVAHPSLSADGKKLYFASDMPGTIGGSDIFYVDLNEDGTFGKPINMGAEINTEGRETFPFISVSNVLYFASDGHMGLGGLDIFAVRLDDDKNDCVLNIGEPVNGKADDFALVLDDNGKNGFFSSNRSGGMGADDIYALTEERPLAFKCVEIINGIVKNSVDGQPLSTSEITIFNRDDKIVAQGISDANGNFTLEPKFRQGNYRIIADKEDYETEEVSFIMTNSKEIENFVFQLKPIIASEGTDLLSYLNLNPVYFDIDESKLSQEMKDNLDRIIDYMRLYPKLRIEIRSFADAKGGEAYNQNLSEKRASETKAYFIEKSTNESRITTKGFGETQLINDCIEWKDCSPEQNKLNRRTSFIVIK